MANTPFKMKGSPMQRNFGIGSPMKHPTPAGEEDHEHPHTGSDKGKEGTYHNEDYGSFREKYYSKEERAAGKSSKDTFVKKAIRGAKKILNK